MNTKTSILLLSIAIGFSAFTSSASAQYAVPTCNSATIHGDVDTYGVRTEAWFEWGQGGSISWSTPGQFFSQDSSFSQLLTNLAENTTYSYRAMAENEFGKATGQTHTFTTAICQQQPSQPTVDISADNPNLSSNNGGTTVRWTSNNATSCSASGGTNSWAGSKSTSGSQSTGVLANTVTYSITCSNSVGSASDSVTISVSAQTCNDQSATNYNQVGSCRYSNVGPTVDIRADDTSINYNSSTLIRWTSTNANTCSSSGGTNGWGGTNRSTSGSFSTGNLTNTVTYIITCSNNSGSASDSVTVSVNGQDNNQNVNVDIWADDTSISFNSSTVVRWSSSNANNCTASGGTNGWSGNRSTSGSFNTGSLNGRVTYSITCHNNNSSDSDSVTVNVSGSFSSTIGEPSVFLTADQFNVGINGSTVVRWTSNNATTCFASGGTPNWPGTRGPSGSFNTGLLTRTTTFYISCSNSVGSAFDSVNIVAQGQPVFFQPATTVYIPPLSQVSLLSLASAADVVGCACDNFASGSDILYTLTYQNNSGSTARNVTLRITLHPETTFVSSAPHNSNMSGNNLTFNVGNVLPNSQGAVMVRLRSRDGMTNGGNVNFYAVADHTNASGQRLSINDSISAQLPNSYAYAPNNNTNTENRFQTAASAATAGVASALTSGAVGWLLLVVLVLLIIILVKHLLTQNQKRTIITTTTP